MAFDASRVPVRLQRVARRVLPDRLWALGRGLVYGETRLQERRRLRRLARLERRHMVGPPGGLRAVAYRGETLVAVPVSRFRASEALAANASLVMDTLDAAGVPFVVVDAPTNRRRVVALSERHAARAVEALRRVSPDELAYGVWVSEAGLADSVRLDRLPRTPRGAQALRVYRAYAAPGGLALGGRDLGCDLELWADVPADVPAHVIGQAVPAGSLRAPRWNRWTEVLLVDERQSAVDLVDGRERPVLPAASTTHQYDVTFPIDVVYTYVDGSDPNWQARKSEAAVRVGADSLHELAANDSRFISRDELKYSMRSLDMYADWVRHVYLVTDGQTPPWLDLDHPKLSVVDHRELFGDRGRLPTFNSHAIESQLHHLEGLAEHYLYLNDDVFFGRPVSPDVFFQSNGVARYFTSMRKLGLGSAQAADIPFMSAGKNNRDLLHKVFEVTITNKFRHVPHAQRRSVLEQLEREFPAQFAETASHQFRSESDFSIAASLHHNYAYRLGLAAPGTLKYLYTDVADPDTEHRLRRLRRNRNVDVFCLNDHTGGDLDPALQAQLVQNFLGRYFPLPSAFEKS